MRVLLVHNRYQQRGGEDAVFEAERDLLERHGHHVVCVEFDNDEIPERSSPIALARLAIETTWSRRAAARVGEAARRHEADVAHFHNTFPLVSPAAYSACHAAGAAVVQTLHNYRLLCPKAVLLRDGAPCEDCLGRTVAWPGVLHACYRGSRIETFTVVTMLAAHRLRGTWKRDVDRYIALSNFGKEKFVEGGLPSERIAVKPNFLAPDPGTGAHERDSFVFVGRLSEEKGLQVLLDAWSRAPLALPLEIVGDGPERRLVAMHAEQSRYIERLGLLPRADVLTVMKSVRALVFPSLWYEGWPVTIIEAFACGLPVIASRLGAMAEMVEDGRTGLLFTPGDPLDLAEKVRWAADHPAELDAMGAAARHAYEAKFTDDHNYGQLMAIYRQAIEQAP